MARQIFADEEAVLLMHQIAEQELEVDSAEVLARRVEFGDGVRQKREVRGFIEIIAKSETSAARPDGVVGLSAGRVWQFLEGDEKLAAVPGAEGKGGGESAERRVNETGLIVGLLPQLSEQLPRVGIFG